MAWDQAFEAKTTLRESKIVRITLLYFATERQVCIWISGIHLAQAAVKNGVVERYTNFDDPVSNYMCLPPVHSNRSLERARFFPFQNFFMTLSEMYKFGTPFHGNF